MGRPVSIQSCIKTAIKLFRLTRSINLGEFLTDYNQGKQEGAHAGRARYTYGEFPELPFHNSEFDLVLCAHFLFFYSDNLTLNFHIQAIREMCRVSKEIRIFPLLDVKNSRLSTYIEPVKKYMDSIGWIAEEVKVDYEFQKNGNSMLKLNFNGKGKL
jgi:ubiquinone/menaquinone biosynthesis C-methylase UbiE